jgi:ferredoxin
MSRALRRGTPLASPVTSSEVKRRARELGADLCGIASAATLNAFPPDPRWPQTPERISPYCKSVIVIVQRIPVGAFRCKTNVPVQYLDMLVLRRMEEQVCIGESCSRCLHSCPPDAVKQWGLDKAGCATEAQEFGFMQITKFFSKYFDLSQEEKKAAVRSRDLFGFWQGLLRVVGSFGDCPRCLAVCPVGNDYHAHLADIQKHIPEKTPEKVAKAAEFKKARKEGNDLPGLNEWNIRWVGENGYQGIVARQLQEFKRLQKEKEKQ